MKGFLVELAKVICEGTDLTFRYPPWLRTRQSMVVICHQSRAEKITIDLMVGDDSARVVVAVIDHHSDQFDVISFELESMNPEIVKEYAISKYLEALELEKSLLQKSMGQCKIAINAAKRKGG